MLSDLQTLLDRATGKKAETLEGDLRSTVRALWDRQFIYADDHGGAKPYELARRHRAYLESLFDAMGFDLVIDERERLVGILDQDGAAPRTLKLDEMLFLLALRVIHAERIASFDLKERGRCDTTLSEVWTLIEERAQRRRPHSPVASRSSAAFSATVSCAPWTTTDRTRRSRSGPPSASR